MRTLFVLCILLAGCKQAKKSINPEIIIESSFGDITVELYPAKAPQTVAAFLKNVETGLYTNSNFYRVIKNEDLSPEYNSGLIQGGIHRSPSAARNNIPFIPHESPSQTGLSHVKGTISMARLAPGTATSEFFICIGDQKQFDSSRRTNPDGQGYAAFGKVTEGFDILRQIQDQKNLGEDFVQPILIKTIRKL